MDDPSLTVISQMCEALKGYTLHTSHISQNPTQQNKSPMPMERQ